LAFPKFAQIGIFGLKIVWQHCNASARQFCASILAFPRWRASTVGLHVATSKAFKGTIQNKWNQVSDLSHSLRIKVS
jgi:hypothetical protein